MRPPAGLSGSSGEICECPVHEGRDFTADDGSLPGSLRLMKIAQWARCWAVERVHVPSGGATESGSGPRWALRSAVIRACGHDRDRVGIAGPPP